MDRHWTHQTQVVFQKMVEVADENGYFTMQQIKPILERLLKEKLRTMSNSYINAIMFKMTPQYLRKVSARIGRVPHNGVSSRWQIRDEALDEYLKL